MNIQFTGKYRSLINIVANSYGQTVESFVIETVISTAKNAKFDGEIANE